MNNNKIDTRRLWEHEDNLINNRITWLGVIQGLLLAAYAVVLKDKNLPGFDNLIFLIPLVGATVSTLILIGILAAGMAIKEIKFLMYQELEGRLPHSQSHAFSKKIIYLGLAPALGIPMIFIFTWIYLACEVS